MTENRKPHSDSSRQDLSKRRLSETDLAADKMGNNQLQGDDQANVHNQRQAQAGVKKTTDGVLEGYEKLDKDVRAKRDLGKGNRSGKA